MLKQEIRSYTTTTIMKKQVAIIKQKILRGNHGKTTRMFSEKNVVQPQEQEEEIGNFIVLMSENVECIIDSVQNKV